MQDNEFLRSGDNEGLKTRIRKRKHLIFSLGDKRYALPLSLVKEVIGMVDITPLPKVPEFYIGMINLRGQIISVIDLRRKLGFANCDIEEKKTCIIISRVGDVVLGTIVDEVLEVRGYEEDRIDRFEAQRTDQSGDGVYGVAKEDDEALTLLIDLEKALNNTDFKVFRNENAA